MDSFSKSSKLEILNQQLDAVKGGIPFLFGLFVSSGSMSQEGTLEISTDIAELYDYILKIIKNIIKNIEKIQKNNKNIAFLNKTDEINDLNKLIILKNDFKINNKLFYKIIFQQNLLKNLFSIYTISEANSISENISRISNSIDEIKGFVKGMYIGSATSSIKISEKANEKTSSGYHLEFASKDIALLREFSHLLAQFDIMAKLITRKNNYVLYLKDAEQVSDLLALVGASNAVLSLKNEITNREFRNKINRQTNCLSGNISKTVDASIKQMEAIELIDGKIGINNLPPDLEEVALMRLANPEEPLTTLLQLSDLNLTKSGLNHRLRKLISLAEKLK